MTEYTIIIPDRPVSWKRPGQSGNRRYDTQKLEKEKIRWLCKEQGIPMFKSVEITIMFLFIPKNCKVWDFMTKKPDIDNLAKLVLDAFTGVIYKDDSVIYRLDLRKYYSDRSETQVFLRGELL